MKKVLFGLVILLGVGAVYFAFLKEPNATVTVAPEANATTLASDSQPATGLSLPGMTDLTGKRAELAGDKLLFINVWATWCGPCIMEMPSIEKLYAHFKDNDKIAFYVISDEGADIVNPFVAKKGYQLPMYLYSGRYPAKLDGNAIPRTYIVKNGEVLVSEVGARDWSSQEVIDVITKELETL